MALALVMLIGLYLLYVLLIKGALWKMILGAFGWLGMFIYLSTIPGCRERPLDNNSVSWAMVIPTIIVLLAMASTKED